MELESVVEKARGKGHELAWVRARGLALVMELVWGWVWALTTALGSSASAWAVPLGVASVALLAGESGLVLEHKSAEGWEPQTAGWLGVEMVLALECKLAEVSVGTLVRLWGSEWSHSDEEQRSCSTWCPPHRDCTSRGSQPCRSVGS